MIATCVYVHVKADKVDDFIAASKANHAGSVNETGNLRFDFLQNANDSTLFMIYEAYESEAAAAEHKNTPHYAKWRDTVADWMAKPRMGVKYNIVVPNDRREW